MVISNILHISYALSLSVSVPLSLSQYLHVNVMYMLTMTVIVRIYEIINMFLFVTSFPSLILSNIFIHKLPCTVHYSIHYSRHPFKSL
jgi:hypothetical protein